MEPNLSEGLLFLQPLFFFLSPKVMALQDSMRFLVEHVTGLGEDPTQTTSKEPSKISKKNKIVGTSDEEEDRDEEEETRLLKIGVWEGKANPLYAKPNRNLPELLLWSAEVQLLVDATAAVR